MAVPIAPPEPPLVPILGKGYELKAFIPTVMLQCQCPAKSPLLMIGLGAKVTCPACRKIFTVTMFRGDASSGQVHVDIAVGLDAGPSRKSPLAI